MQVHYDIANLPSFNNAIITIGTFDGVHQGHRRIIEKLKEQATAVGGETVIITFHPHPRKVVASTILGIRLINSLHEKIELLAKAGIEHVVVVPFTEAFAHQPPEAYLKDFLVDKFHPHTIIIGYDHRFGKDRAGDYLMLEKFAPVYNYQLQEIPRHLLYEIGISSTRIREAILHCEMDIANKLLGYEFFFSGEVVHGDKLGRKLGYPTANLKMLDDEKIIPGDGIYAVYAQLIAQHEVATGPAPTPLFKGMMSIGFRPTVDGKKRVVEVNIFDFNEEIYGKVLRVYVKKFLRQELKFDNLQDLVKQIDQDKVESLKIL
jgi:riboflavin kinase / FMN adenylyltransferase